MIVLLVITLQVTKRCVHPVPRANTNPVSTNQVAKTIATPVLSSIRLKRPVPNAALANTKIKTIKPVVKLANPGNPPTLIKLDVPDVLQVNIQAMEVVKNVKVVNTKMKPIKPVANPIVLLVITLQVTKRRVLHVPRANTNPVPTNQVANPIVLLVITLQVTKRRVLLVPRANTNPVPTNQVAKTIATPALPLIQRKRPATYATLVNTKTKTTKLIVSIVG
jgi:hypothetical protein